METVKSNILCRNGWHNYSPRYSTKMPESFSGTGIPIAALEFLGDKVYCCDVCKRCGHVASQQVQP